jgi:hypothetical protein
MNDTAQSIVDEKFCANCALAPTLDSEEDAEPSWRPQPGIDQQMFIRAAAITLFRFSEQETSSFLNEQVLV